MEEARAALQAEFLNVRRQEHDAQAILQQRAAIASSHAHHHQRHKNTKGSLGEKISHLDNDRKEVVDHCEGTFVKFSSKSLEFF